MSPSWLDKKFLEQALGKEVLKYEVRTVGGKNANFTSNLYGVSVELETNERLNLFVKKIMETKGVGLSVKESTMFDRETHMYTVVLPKMEALLKKAIPGCEPLTPRHFYSGTGVLVLEDLSEAGFGMLDMMKGMDLYHARLVMQTLARFHSASLVLHEQNPEYFKPYEDHIFTEPAIVQSLNPFFTNSTRGLADEVITWPVYGERYAKKFREFSANFMELAEETVRRREDRFNVLSHGDFWMNNILIRSPDGVRFIDFQMTHFSSLGNDLQQFVASSLMSEARRNHVDTLLKEYHTTFCDTLSALRYSGRILTFQEVQEEFRKSAPHFLLLCLAFAPLFNLKSDADIVLFQSKDAPRDQQHYSDAIKAAVTELIDYFEKQGAFDYFS